MCDDMQIFGTCDDIFLNKTFSWKFEMKDMGKASVLL